MSWQPMFGGWPEYDGTRFRLWATSAESVEVAILTGDHAGKAFPLYRDESSVFTAHVPGVMPGTCYNYRLPGRGDYPDPASRFQPEGVHGPSEIVDACRFPWTDANWQGIARDRLVIYELHVGTFTPQGTFEGVIARLPYLVDLGITAIELMPLADFPGQRNWGYDGVCLFAPARCYGTPDDLRRLVDEAHRHGLAVLLDVVYNHFGPDGNYLGVYTSAFQSTCHESPWGAALNFDGDNCQLVREFFLDNALYWLHDFHLDGLRLDATHAILDDSPRHFLAEQSSRVQQAGFSRPIHLIAEDHRNLARMVQPHESDGWGLTGVWADDFHHQVRCLLAGDRESYYRAFTGTTNDLAATVQQGWFFSGQFHSHSQKPRGTDPTPLSPPSFVICLQNHDQVGNRAFGERLHHQIDPAAYRAASTLLLCCPQTPMLFMGQEFAASTPFLFFTDHVEQLGQQITQGRRKEFRHFGVFSDPQMQQRIPDPQAESTFQSSKLPWHEAETDGHVHLRNLYRTLLQLRRDEPAMQSCRREDYDCFVLNDNAIGLERRAEGARALLLVCQFKGFGSVDLLDAPPTFQRNRRWRVRLTSEDPGFLVEGKVPVVCLREGAPLLYFFRPGAVLLQEG